uniref:Uncharacterized protein n=1 Tax=Glossina morsitans morsitans TaxID=37546 RepID=A0ABK9NG17_GLOMM
MFTDTKNVMNACHYNDVTMHTMMMVEKSEKCTLKKILKPLERLISLKTRNKKATVTSSVPNNVNLNNALANVNKESTYDKPVKQAKEISTNHKLLTDEHWMAVDGDGDGDPSKHNEIILRLQPEVFIRSVNIEKPSSLNACIHCVYGRNCQHVVSNSSNICDENNCLALPVSTEAIENSPFKDWLWSDTWPVAKMQKCFDL